MSLNIGSENSKFVVVKNPTLKLAYSEKVIFADLTTSKKTGKSKTNKDTGEVILDEHGNPVAERAYSKWSARFVGDAFEAARGFGSFQMIDIDNGWIEQDVYFGKDGKKFINYIVVISEFSLSSVKSSDVDEHEDFDGESNFYGNGEDEDLPF